VITFFVPLHGINADSISIIQPTITWHDYSVRQGIETSTGALAINTGEYTIPWIDLSLKTVLLKTKFGGEVNIPLNLQL
jgi:hypothetical protein